MDPNPRPSKLDRLRNRIRGISPLPVRTTTASSRAPSPISTCIGSPAPDASSTQQQPSSTAPQYLKTQAAAAAASLDSSATTGDAPRAPVIHPRVEPGQRIFDTAIRALSEEDQSTVKALVLHEELGNVKDVQDAVLAQKRTCEERRWTISVKGYNLGLGDVAGALSLLLDKIQPGINLVSQMAAVAKPGVDLAASIDPLHIGIPLALIKAALGVMIFTSEQMEKLLSGMIMTTFMLQQLSLYFEYFKQVDSPTEAKSLEDVLSSTYSLVFGFLLVGQCALSKRGPKRAFELLWSKNKVDEYERSCESAAQKLEMAANHCHRNGSHKQLRDMMGRIELIMSEMKRLDIVRATVQALNVKLDLHRLRPASGAAYEVVDDPKELTVYNYCLEGTRQKLIEQINSWCHQSHQKVFWVCGMAGTGKSTLIRTVARQIETEGLLAASFFFRQDIADQKDATLFVQSIVAQLIKKYPILRPHVAAALDNDLTLPGGSISNQFKRLVKEPISKAGLANLVLIVDALDECKQEHAKVVLANLALLAKELRLRIVLTSRPESDLRAAFDDLGPDSIRMEEVKEGVEPDLRLFFRTFFSDLVEKDAKRSTPHLEAGWPDDETIEKLVTLAMPLFIFAATVIRYVSEYKPKERLVAVLKENQNTNVTGIDRVYLPILQQIYTGADDQVRADFQSVAGPLILLRNPLSIPALSSLLGLSLADVGQVLEPLHSVLRVPNDLNSPVQILHKSFKDFLLESKHEFSIDNERTHDDLLRHCLRLMEDKLHMDICKVKAPGLRRVAFTQVSSYITPELEYACLYWSSHVREAIQDGGLVHRFLERHFLHWLEALSWLNRLSSAFTSITELLDRFEVSRKRRVYKAFLTHISGSPRSQIIGFPRRRSTIPTNESACHRSCSTTAISLRTRFFTKEQYRKSDLPARALKCVLTPPECSIQMGRREAEARRARRQGLVRGVLAGRQDGGVGVGRQHG